MQRLLVGMRKTVLVESIARGGPYSHAVISDSRIYVSGQLGLDGKNKDDFASQFNLAMVNISKILSAAGKSVAEISKLMVFLKRKEDFDMLNVVFEKHFPSNPPARTTIVCNFRDEDVLVELDATV